MGTKPFSSGGFSGPSIENSVESGADVRAEVMPGRERFVTCGRGLGLQPWKSAVNFTEGAGVCATTRALVGCEGDAGRRGSTDLEVEPR